MVLFSLLLPHRKSQQGVRTVSYTHLDVYKRQVQAYRILNKAAVRVGINGEIGTHTLRKTFGYHMYMKTKDVALLQELFNHSSPSVTLRYIGINQDRLDQAMDDFRL